MKRVKMLISVFCVVVLLLCGCQMKPSVDTSSSIEFGQLSQAGESGGEFFDSFFDRSVTYLPADFETLYPGKKKLVWLLNDSVLGNDPAVFMQLNERLAQRGCDFAVQGVLINSGAVYSQVSEDGLDTAYQNFVRQWIEAGRQADLFMTDVAWGQPESRKYIRVTDYFAKNQLALPLDDYLQGENGKELYQAIDPRIWRKNSYENQTYGVANYLLGTFRYLEVNKSMAEKYGVTPEDLQKDLWELEDILKRVYEGEGGRITPYLCSTAWNVEVLPYEFATTAVGCPIEGEATSFCNIYEEEYVQKLFRTIHRYKELGYLKAGVNMAKDGVMSDAYECNGESVFILSTAGKYREDLPVLEEDRSYRNIVDVGDEGPVYENCAPFPIWNIQTSHYSRISGAMQANCISARSTQADQAFEMLCLAYTDEEIANLLFHGVEGRNYEVQDGYAVELKESETGDDGQVLSYNSKNYMSPISNCFLTLPKNFTNMEEPLDKAAAYANQNANTADSCLEGFYFDPSAVQDKIDAMDAVLAEAEYAGLWTGTCEDVDGTLQKLNEELKAAGMEEVVAAANAQLQAWKSN